MHMSILCTIVNRVEMFTGIVSVCLFMYHNSTRLDPDAIFALNFFQTNAVLRRIIRWCTLKGKSHALVFSYVVNI